MLWCKLKKEEEEEEKIISPWVFQNILARFLKLPALEIAFNGARGVKATLFDTQKTLLIEKVEVC